MNACRVLPIPEPTVAPPRRTGRALPPYRYVPGLLPHPFRHPQGHAWQGGGAPEPAAWSAGPWQRDEAWLHGLELFEHRYYWECHEVIEGIWHQLPEGHLRRLAQAIIQAAAACLRAHSGDSASAERLRRRALHHLSAIEVPAVHGVQIASLRTLIRAGEPYPSLSTLTEAM